MSEKDDDTPILLQSEPKKELEALERVILCG